MYSNGETLLCAKLSWKRRNACANALLCIRYMWILLSTFSSTKSISRLRSAREFPRKIEAWHTKMETVQISPHVEMKIHSWVVNYISKFFISRAARHSDRWMEHSSIHVSRLISHPRIWKNAYTYETDIADLPRDTHLISCFWNELEIGFCF